MGATCDMGARMARILVTGGAGFIGSHLCDALVARGDEVFVLDNLSLGRRENLAPLGDRVTIIHDDVANVAKHADQLAGVTHIVHLAALISGYDSLHQPDAYVRENVTALLRVLEFAKSLQRPRLVFASSSTVYGNTDGVTCVETNLPAPVTLYALTKLAGEHLLEMYRGLYGYEYCALRLFNVYGPRQNPHHPYANVTCKFSFAAAGDGRVKLYGDGKQTRDFVSVDDVVRAVVRVLEPTPSRLYNVGTGTDASIATLLSTVEAVAERKLEVEQLPPWSNDIRAIRADVTRAARELGFSAQTSLEVGLRRTVRFFRSTR
jgi:UDP-glucose 4-epimerase